MSYPPLQLKLPYLRWSVIPDHYRHVGCPHHPCQIHYSMDDRFPSPPYLLLTGQGLSPLHPSLQAGLPNLFGAQTRKVIVCRACSASQARDLGSRVLGHSANQLATRALTATVTAVIRVVENNGKNLTTPPGRSSTASLYFSRRFCEERSWSRASECGCLRTNPIEATSWTSDCHT